MEEEASRAGIQRVLASFICTDIFDTIPHFLTPMQLTPRRLFEKNTCYSKGLRSVVLWH